MAPFMKAIGNAISKVDMALSTIKMDLNLKALSSKESGVAMANSSLIMET